MRIVSGIYGGRILKAPKNQDIRPTSDKIRGAIFNALRSMNVVENAYVLDGFCGTGALGLEALSQGASHCTFIDKNKNSLALCKENIESLNANENSKLLLKDCSKLPVRPNDMKPISLVFLDPPYEKDLITPTLQSLHQKNWLENKATIVLESEKHWSEATTKPYTLISEKTYGDTKVRFLHYQDNT